MDFEKIFTYLKQELTPLNVFLLTILMLLTYSVLKPTPPIQYEIEEELPELEFKQYTPIELSEFNGEKEKRILMAVKTDIFDVTRGGPYENFSGRDASRGLALNSFDSDVLVPLDGPIDILDNLDKEEVESLDDWHLHFKSKYPLVGKLIENKKQ